MMVFFKQNVRLLVKTSSFRKLGIKRDNFAFSKVELISAFSAKFSRLLQTLVKHFPLAALLAQSSK